MTIAKTGSEASYSGNGSTVNFAFAFRFFEDSDLTVSIVLADGTTTVQTLTTHYTASNNGDETGGTVSMVTPPASGETLLIQRDIPETQGTDYTANDAFPAETHEAAIDRLTLLVQDTSRAIASEVSTSARYFKATYDSDAVGEWDIQTQSDRANKVLGFNSAGLPIMQEAEITVSLDVNEILDVAALVADTAYGYSAGTIVSTGDIIVTRTEGFRYEVAASGATDEDLTTAGGVKLYVLPLGGVILPTEAFNIKWDGATDDTTAWQAFLLALPGYGTAFPAGGVSVVTSKLAVAGEGFVIAANGAELDFSGMLNGDADPDGALFRIFGSTGTAINISAISSADASNNVQTVIVETATAHGLSTGAEVLISSDDLIDIGHTTAETRGQYVTVAKAATKLTTTGAITVVAGETLTQATSGATGVVVLDSDMTDATVYVEDTTGTFNTSNELTGSISGALGANSVPSAVATDTAFTTVEPLYETLPTNPVMTPINWRENIRITGNLKITGPGRRPTAAGFIGLSFVYARDCYVEGLETDGVDYQAFVRESCRRVHMGTLLCRFDDAGVSTAVQYGDTFKNVCTDCTTRLVTCYNGKHAVDFTRNTNPGIARHCRIEHVIAYGTWDAATAMHGNARDCSIGKVEAYNCLYGVNIRAPGWRVDDVFGENVSEVLRLTDDPRDLSVGSVRGKNVTYGLRATDTDWIGTHESRNIRVARVEVEGCSGNSVHLDFSDIPVYDEGDAAVTGGSATTVTMGDFPDANYNNSGALTGSEIVLNHSGVGTPQTRIITGHAYSGGVNTLTVSTWTSNPIAGVSTYDIRSFVDDISIGDIVSKNCDFADAYFYGNFRRLRIGSIEASHESVTAQPCLWLESDVTTYAEDVTLGRMDYFQKNAPLIEAENVDFVWHQVTGVFDTMNTEFLSVDDDGIIITTIQTPASAAATGVKGTLCWDASYVYVCTATDTWVRAALATW